MPAFPFYRMNGSPPRRRRLRGPRSALARSLSEGRVNPAPRAMPTLLPLDRARADWLSGDASAWARYLSCLRVMDAARAKASAPSTDRARTRRRPRRPRAKA